MLQNAYHQLELSSHFFSGKIYIQWDAYIVNVPFDEFWQIHIGATIIPINVQNISIPAESPHPHPPTAPRGRLRSEFCHCGLVLPLQEGDITHTAWPSLHLPSLFQLYGFTSVHVGDWITGFIVWRYHSLSTCSPIAGQSGCFQFRATRNRLARHSCASLFVDWLMLIWEIPLTVGCWSQGQMYVLFY